MPWGTRFIADAADDLAARRLAEVEAVGEVGHERLQPRLQRLGRADLVAVRARWGARRRAACAISGDHAPAALTTAGHDALERTFVPAARADVLRDHGAICLPSTSKPTTSRNVSTSTPSCGRRLREAPDEGPGEDDPVVGVVARRDDAVGGELGHELPRLLRRQHAGGEAALVLHASRSPRAPAASPRSGRGRGSRPGGTRR